MTTITFANQITTVEFSFTVDSWMNLTVQQTQGVTFLGFPPHYTIHHCPGPNLPFHISSYLSHNCLLKVHVNKCPFPPSLESFMVYAVKDVGLKWWKVCFKQNTKSPFKSLWLRMGTFQWCFPWLQGMKASSIPKGTEKPEGSSARVFHSSFCNMKCLEVLLLPLDGMLVHQRWPQAIVRLP